MRLSVVLIAGLCAAAGLRACAQLGSATGVSSSGASGTGLFDNGLNRRGSSDTLFNDPWSTPQPGVSILDGPESSGGLTLSNLLPPASQMGSLGKWLEPLSDRVRISGRKSLGYHVNSVSGDRRAFGESTYYGRGDRTFTDYTELSVTGRKLFDRFSIDWKTSNTPFASTTNKRFTLGYDYKGLKAEYGDVQSRIQGNELASFNKLLRGVQVSLRTAGKNPVMLTGVYSQTRGAARTVVLYGNDTSGPYYLNAGQLIPGSDRVRVDNREMVRGRDYEIDTFAGIITFSPGLIIARSSTILVSFEADSYNNDAGEIRGYRMEAPAGNAVLGYVQLEQRSASGGAVRTKTDSFYGYNNPLSPYELQYPADPAGILTATVDGVLQVRGTKRGEGDFFLDAEYTYRVYFNRAIPPTSLVRITYIPRSDGGTVGNRRVQAYDAKWRVSPNLQMVYSEARSVAQRGSQDIHAGARLFGANMRFGPWTLSSRYRDIDPSYTSVESTGFFRQERGLSNHLEYQGGPLEMRLTTDSLKVPDYTGSLISGAALNESSVNNTNLTVGFRKSNWPDLRFDHYDTRADGSTSYSRSRTTSLSASRSFGALRTDASLTHSDARSNSGALGAVEERTQVDTTRLAATWAASERFSLSGSMAISAISLTDGHRNAQDATASLRWEPLPAVEMNYQYSQRDSGASVLAASGGGGSFIGQGGFQSGWGMGFGSGGSFSGGYTNPFAGGMSYASTGVRSTGHHLSLSWMPGDALSADVGVSQQYAAGDNLTNTDMWSIDGGLAIRLTRTTDATMRISRQQLKYVGSADRSESTILYGTVRTQAIPKFTLSLDGQHMVTDSVFASSLSGSSYDPHQVLRSLAFRADRPIAARQSLFGQYRWSDMSGQYGTRDTEAALGYEYEITPFVVLTASLRDQERRYRSVESQKYNYRARTFDVDLSARF